MSDYQKARADEVLSHKALDRAQLLYDQGRDRGQRSRNRAGHAKTKPKSMFETAEHHVRVLGADPAHPSPLIDSARPDGGNDRRAERRWIRRRQEPGQHAQSFYHRRSEPGVGGLRRVRKRSRRSASRATRRKSSSTPLRIACFSGTVADISRVLDPEHAIGESTHRAGRTATAHCAPECLRWPSSARGRRPSASWSPRPRSCACMIKTGFSARKAANRFRRMVVQADGLDSRRSAGDSRRREGRR